MATMHLTGATVRIGGVDLTDHVTDIELPIEAEPSESGWATDRLAALKDGTLSVDFFGHWDGPMPLFDLPVERTISITLPPHVARAWLALLERRQRARIRRMHAAYRRRKQGRW